MDGECAFCGRANGATHQVSCEDCRTHHNACRACADEVTSAEIGLYRAYADEVTSVETGPYRVVG